MTKAHELDRTKQTATPAGSHDDAVAPGRIARSAALVGPNGPMPSGLIQRKARDANGVEEGAGDAVARASSSSGAALPEGLMRKFESSLGADLSGVRVHTGSESADAASAVGAKAYTLGQDIHFGTGHFDPSSSTGEHLLAHEVAHTVQQRGGVARMQLKPAVSLPGDAHEVEADRAADAMVSGSAFAIAGTAPDGIHREPEAAKDPTVTKGYRAFGPAKKKFGKIGPVDVEGNVGLKVDYVVRHSPSGEAAKDSEHAGGDGERKDDNKTEVTATKGGGSGLGTKFDVELEKKLWHPGNFQYVANGGIEKTKNGIGLKGGIAYKHSFFGAGTVEVQPVEVQALGANYDEKTGKWEVTKGAVASHLKFAYPMKVADVAGYQTELTGELQFEAVFSPDWEEILKKLLKREVEEQAERTAEKTAAKKLAEKGAEKVVENGARQAAADGTATAGAGGAEGIDTGLAAVSAESAAMAVGFLAIAASVVWAFTKSVNQMADYNGLKAEGVQEVNDAYQGALAALGAGGSPASANGGLVFAHMDPKIWAKVNEILQKHPDCGLSPADIRKEICKAALSAGTAERARDSCRHHIAARCAQEYYNKHFDDFLGGEGIEQDASLMAKTIYAHIMGDSTGHSFDGWSPSKDAARAAKSASDKRDAEEAAKSGRESREAPEKAGRVF